MKLLIGVWSVGMSFSPVQSLEKFFHRVQKTLVRGIAFFGRKTFTCEIRGAIKAQEQEL
jgi:hypothetical protein